MKFSTIACGLITLTLFPQAALAQGVISSGQNGNGSILTSFEEDTWTFSASSGDNIIISIGETSDLSGSFSPWIRLFAPDGSFVDSDSGTAASIFETAEQTGTYSIIVADIDNTSLGDDTGTYRLNLAKLPGPFTVADDGGALTNGGNHDGAIGVGDLDLWSFDATTGDSLVVSIGQLTDDNGSFSPWILLYAPDGSFIDADSGTAAAVFESAQQTGSYTVVVADIDNTSIGDDTGTYRLRLARVPGSFTVADDGGALTNGGNHDGTTEVGDLDMWTFDATIGDSLIVSIGQLTDDNGSFSPWILLYGPDGSFIGADSGTAASIVESAEQTGTYTVIATDIDNTSLGDDTGTYRLHLAQIPGEFTVPDEGGALTNGENHDGTIEVGDLDMWSFHADVGENLIVSIGELTDISGSFFPWIRLYAPDGTFVGSDSDSKASVIFEFTEQAGTYTVVVADIDNTSLGEDTGTYRLRLAKVPGPFVVADDGGALTNGANHEGTIEVGDLDMWSFHADAGENIIVSVGELTDTSGSFSPWILLYAPDGSFVGSDSGSAAAIFEYTEQTGTYTVVAADIDNTSLGDDTGTYRLHFAHLPGAYVIGDEGGELTNNNTRPGVTSIGDLDIWSFEANQGDNIALTLTELTDNGGYTPWMFLYNPDGSFSAEDEGTIANIFATAQETGTYNVVVFEQDNTSLGNDTGTYEISVSGLTAGAKIPLLQAVRDGERTVSISWELPAEGWILEETSTTLPLDWQEAQAPTQVAEKRQLNVSGSEPWRLYRLRKP